MSEITEILSPLPATSRKLKSIHICKYCENQFTATRSSQIFCNRKCKDSQREKVRPKRNGRFGTYGTIPEFVRRSYELKSRQTIRSDRPWVSILNGAKRRAKKFGIPYDIDNIWAKQRFTGYCELTGLPFDFSHPSKKGPTCCSMSIDQIVPRKGYTKDNCRFVLWAVNCFKSNWSDEDVYKVAEALILHRYNMIGGNSA